MAQTKDGRKWVPDYGHSMVSRSRHSNCSLPEATMHICSLLPSATEIVCTLGLAEQLVAVSHECDFPPEVRSKPVITSSRIDPTGRSGAAIDALVSSQLHDHTGIYALDEALLRELKPDLILTQELCDVCAVSYEQVQVAVRALRGDQVVLSLEPTCVSDILATIAAVGRATGSESRASELIAGLEAQLRDLAAHGAGRSRRWPVACLEWLDPPFSAGHWVPEMVQSAGGRDLLATAGERSQRLSWVQVLEPAPEVLVLMPCGFNVERTVAEYQQAQLPAGWASVPAVQSSRVFAVDANAYFSRPGPRVTRGIEILGEILTACETGATDGNGWRRMMTRRPL